LVDVVMVGLGPSQLRGERAEGVGVDDGLGLLVGESAGADEPCPAVVLGGLGDGLVFGDELCDRAPCLLLGGDGLVGGKLGPDMLQYAEQNGAGGRVGVVGGVRRGVVVGAVEHHVSAVGVAAAGHRDVEVL